MGAPPPPHRRGWFGTDDEGSGEPPPVPPSLLAPAPPPPSVFANHLGAPCGDGSVDVSGLYLYLPLAYGWDCYHGEREYTLEASSSRFPDSGFRSPCVCVAPPDPEVAGSIGHGLAYGAGLLVLVVALAAGIELLEEQARDAMTPDDPRSGMRGYDPRRGGGGREKQNYYGGYGDGRRGRGHDDGRGTDERSGAGEIDEHDLRLEQAKDEMIKSNLQASEREKEGGRGGDEPRLALAPHLTSPHPDFARPAPPQLETVAATIQLTVAQAVDLPAMDVSVLSAVGAAKASSDPYVVVQFGRRKFKTAVKDDTLNPVWDQVRVASAASSSSSPSPSPSPPRSRSPRPAHPRTLPIRTLRSKPPRRARRSARSACRPCSLGARGLCTTRTRR